MTFLAWISAGWPEWVAEADEDIDPVDFNSEINRILGKDSESNEYPMSHNI